MMLISCIQIKTWNKIVIDQDFVRHIYLLRMVMVHYIRVCPAEIAQISHVESFLTAPFARCGNAERVSVGLGLPLHIHNFA
jgi:hypothetical protein